MIFYSDYASAINDNTASAILVNADHNDDNIAAVNIDNSCRFAIKCRIS